MVSDSAEPNSDGVTKSPCSAATCITKLLRKSSPTSGSNTIAVAKNASDQSRVAVSLLDVLARLLPDRVLLPGLDVRLAVEALDLVVEVEVVEDQVLREAQLVHARRPTARC